MIEVREVKTKKEIRDFINFPLKLYKGNPYFVPCFYSDEVALFKPNYLYSDQADYCCFIAYEGKKVVFGFRPEAIVLGEGEGYKINCSVELTELLGDNTNVYVDIQGEKSILKVNPHDTPEMDSKITFTIPLESVYLFDGESEKVIK